MFSAFCSKDMSKFSLFSKFSQLVQPSLLCCDWLFEFFLLCDWLFRTVRLQAQNSAIRAKLLFLGANQNAGIASDCKMDIIVNETFTSGFELVQLPQTTEKGKRGNSRSGNFLCHMPPPYHRIFLQRFP